MEKIIMPEDFTRCYEAVKKFLNCTGHAQVASSIVIETLKFSKEDEEATKQLLLDLSSLMPSNACSTTNHLPSYVKSNNCLADIQIISPVSENTIFDRLSNLGKIASHHQLPKSIHLDINLKVLQEQITKHSVAFLKNNSLFFQMSNSYENDLMGSVRSFALILNSVEDGSAIFSLFEESVRRRETSFALCNEYDIKKIMVKHSIIESKDDKESQKSDSVTVVDRKEERHEAKGSPVFGCLNDQGSNTESNYNKAIRNIQESDNTTSSENSNSSDSFSFSRIVPKQKTNLDKTKMKDDFNILNEDLSNDELCESKYDYLKPPTKSISPFDIRVYSQNNCIEKVQYTQYALSKEKLIAGRYLVNKFLCKELTVPVMECYDQRYKRKVCIKVVEADIHSNIKFINEVKILRIIQQNQDENESYCVNMYDFFYYNGRYFIVQELLQYNLYKGIVLSVQNEKFRFTLGKIQRIAYQVLKGLKKLHSLNILHCDLKPENISIEKENPYKIKIIDFGNSLFLNDQNTYDTIQTIYYRAPEIVLKLPFDGKIDIWSLGCILAELWLGYPLFPCNKESSLLVHMIATLGPFPSQMIKQSKRLSQCYFEKCLNLKKNNLDDRSQTRLHTVRVFKPSNFSLKDTIGTQAPDFLDFLTLLLHLQPSKRPNACEALEHVWLQPGLYPDGL